MLCVSGFELFSLDAPDQIKEDQGLVHNHRRLNGILP